MSKTLDFDSYKANPEQVLRGEILQKPKLKKVMTSLARLINERLAYMEDVAAYKWVHHLVIEDLEREQVVLEGSIQRAKLYKLDSLSTRQFIEQ